MGSETPGTPSSTCVTVFEQAAQVAIGEDAHHVRIGIDHQRSAQALGTHLAHDLAEIGIQRYGGRCVAGAHHVGHGGEQAATQGAAGVRAGEVLGLEAARIEQRHGQRVAQRQLRGGAGGGRQVERAGFLLDAANIFGPICIRSPSLYRQPRS